MTDKRIKEWSGILGSAYKTECEALDTRADPTQAALVPKLSVRRSTWWCMKTVGAASYFEASELGLAERLSIEALGGRNEELGKIGRGVGDASCSITRVAGVSNFDASMTVDEFLFPPRVSRALKRVIRLHHAPLSVSYALSITLRAVCFYAPARVGRALAPTVPLLQLPATIAVIVLWRVKYARILLRTFEFWYFLVLNSLWLVALWLVFADARVCMLPLIWLEFQNETLMDAYFAKMNDILVAAVVTIAQLLMLMVGFLFDLIDDAEHVELVGTAHRTLTTRDVLLYTTSSVIFLMGRLLYRRRATGAPSSRQPNTLNLVAPDLSVPRSSTVNALAYQCKLVLKTVSEASAPPLRVASARTVENQSFLSMRLAHMNSVAYRIPREWCRPHTSRATVTRVGHACAAVISIVATALSFQISLEPPEDELWLLSLDWMPLLGFVSTLVCLSPFSPHYSRRLLYKLATSFDAAMLSLKATAAIVCLCDMLQWRSQRCLPVACVWLWWHWVLAVDALPPVSKTRLGVRLRWCVVPILVLAGVAQTVLACELLFWNNLKLRDRELLHFRLHANALHPKVVIVRVAPFLLSRLFSIFVWTWWLVYRVVVSKDDDELILLTGTVEYEIPSKSNPTGSATRPPRAANH